MGQGFFRHRTGRIGASVSGSVCRSNPVQPSQSLIKQICYPSFFQATSKAILHGCKYEATAIAIYEKHMQSHHKNFKVIKCGLFVNKEFSFLHATPDFLTYYDCCGEGCGEMKYPISIENLDFENYAKKDCSCLELVHGRFRLKRSHIYYDQVQQQLFTCNKPHNDFVVCAFDSNGNSSFVIERSHPDNAHWQTALQKLTTFWRICILPEILGRWYTRKCHLEVVLPADSGICYCRSTDQENTVTCSNNDCPFAKFHSSCLAITGPLPRKRYCPHCRRLPKFKKARAKPRPVQAKGKERNSAGNNEAMAMVKLCICQSKPQQTDRLLPCNNVNCKEGKYFHLNCLGYRRMPSNSKTTWVCYGCKTNKVPVSLVNTEQKISNSETGTATTCTFQQCNTTDRSDTGLNTFTDDECEITGKFDVESERLKEFKRLDENDFSTILSPEGWLDCTIIQNAHVKLKQVNPLIEGFQRPTLGPVRNFVQILHTGNHHWVCVTSIGCQPGIVNLYDSLFHEVVETEVEEQVKSLLPENFVGITNVPVQQQLNGSDCGVFAIAFATCLVYGIKPEGVTFDIPKMRPHLLHCLNAHLITPFPTF